MDTSVADRHDLFAPIFGNERGIGKDCSPVQGEPVAQEPQEEEPNAETPRPRDPLRLRLLICWLIFAFGAFVLGGLILIIGGQPTKPTTWEEVGYVLLMPIPLTMLGVVVIGILTDVIPCAKMALFFLLSATPWRTLCRTARGFWRYLRTGEC